MSSLVETLKQLEADLTAKPIRIAAHSSMPFAIFRYAPTDEFPLRRQLRLLAISLQNQGRRVTFLSLARVVWEIIGMFDKEDLFRTEASRGFDAAQAHVNHLMDSSDFKPAAEVVLEKIAHLSPEKDVVFMVRTGGFAPHIYRSSCLLDGLHNHTQVTIVLFYPGSAEIGTDLRFFDLPTLGNLGVYNYRVRVYGAES